LSIARRAVRVGAHLLPKRIKAAIVAQMDDYAERLLDSKLRAMDYYATRAQWQVRALQCELFGPPQPTTTPPREVPADLVDAFTMNGAARLEYCHLDSTYPPNYPLIYTDAEIDSYLSRIDQNLRRPEHERNIHWNIYGTLDQWVCSAIEKYPIRGKSVVNMGSMTPWYEAMFILFGAQPVTIDYNPILLRTKRMKFMTIGDWERDRPRFDVGFSISSFEHDGLGMYGDPLDPDGDLKAMGKMKERLKPGGLLMLAVPTGPDRIVFNTMRVYGRKRLPMLMDGWEWLDSFGFRDEYFDRAGACNPFTSFEIPKD
jgi:SAM-dependent methyltransferase